MLNQLLSKIRKKMNSRRELAKLFSAFEENCNLLIFHRKKSLKATASTTDELMVDSNENDLILISRIASSYRKSNSLDVDGSMWEHFFAVHHLEIHDALVEGDLDRIKKLFRDPCSTELFHGFDILTKSFNGVFSKRSIRDAYAAFCLDGLVRFAESAAAINIENPESSLINRRTFDTDSILDSITKKCWNFSVPNPFPGEHGLLTAKGVISYRVPQALYQAWRIKQILSGVKEPKVLEIGGGLGRTAHYAYELGVKDYTIIDLPISAAAQSYFLGRTIGSENIILEGEAPQEHSQKVKILQPSSFLNGKLKYDLIINVDSFTEMNESTAAAYWEKIKSSSNAFLSINHEINPIKMSSLIEKDGSDITGVRFPYWMRKGYVEEFFTW